MGGCDLKKKHEQIEQNNSKPTQGSSILAFDAPLICIPIPTTQITMTSEPQQQQCRQRKRRRPLTNTNTDMLCSDGSLPSKWMYRFNLWTGLYMLNPYERIVFHLVGWFSLTVSLLYVYVFWKGFAEGFQQTNNINP